MYLSRIAINTQRYETLRALQKLELLHGMIESSFPSEHQRTLWRLDILNGTLYLLVLSTQQPDFRQLIRQIGFEGDHWETRDYSVLLNRIQAGTVWHFRLTANPTVSVPGGHGCRGKVKAITIAAHQREWLKSQGLKHGFQVQEGSYDVIRSEWKIFEKKGEQLSLLSATFEGLLKVTDPALFCSALTEGIGRGKAYGLGMLTVVSYG